MLIVAMHS